MTTGPHSPEKDAVRQRLYELIDDTEATPAAAQRRALELGRKYLGLTNGRFERRTVEGTDDPIASVGEQPEPAVDRLRTFCRRTIDTQSPLALSEITEQRRGDEPTDEDHEVGCYLGATVVTDSGVYGTVCFSSRSPRQTGFSPDETAFVELIARLLGRTAEAEPHGQCTDTHADASGRSETSYEALLQLAPSAIFVVDADTGRIETANDRAARLTGYTEAELHGKSVLEIHPTDDRDRYVELLAEGFDERVQTRFDDGSPLLIRRSDGTEIPIELGVSRVDLGGQTVLLGVVRDISERRHREAELVERRELFKQIQEVVGLGGWMIDLDGDADAIRVTDEIYRIAGLPVGTELTVEDALDYFHPEDQPAATDALERLTREGKPYDMELRVETVDGDVRWVRAIGRPQYDDHVGDRKPSSILGIVQDITDRKERERDLRIKEQAIEESMVGITISDATDPALPIVYANTGFEEMTGYSRASAMGKNCQFLQGEKTDEETTTEIRRAIEAEEPIQTEILNYRANGTPFWNELTISPVVGPESGEITHFVGVQNDITAQKRRERLIGVLDRVLRHNLRNDMNVMIGFSGAIAQRTDGEVARMASRIHETASGLVSLSNKVRSFETDMIEEESLYPRDIRQDVRSVVDGLRADYPDTEFSVEIDDTETVLATEQIELALAELGDNAASYGDGTAVRYEVTTTAEGRVAIQVRDSGPGLPTIERQVLESGRETPLEHGSGLGLWMVNWIVTGLGGNVTATVDDGTTVTITLPPAAETDADDRRPSAFDATE